MLMLHIIIATVAEEYVLVRNTLGHVIMLLYPSYAIV